MKKMILTLLMVTGLAASADAQGIKEWFSQKATQTEYLIQQVAALQVYIGFLERGYEIVQGGLNTIGNITNGHLSLDNVFFDGLKAIPPKVKRYARVADIVALNIQVLQRSGRTLKAARTSGRFSDGELGYVNQVFAGVADGCGALIDELTQLLTAGDLQLSDDARIARIDGLYADMKERYGFVNNFCTDLDRLQVQRSQELRDAGTLQQMYGP